MSRATKRKHVQMEVLQDDFSLPSENQQIVKVLSSRGNNLHEVESPDGSNFLISMPTKFRKNVWVKRGNFILVEPIKEGDKVKAEMVRVLTKDHIKHFKNEGIWPEKFNDSNSNKKEDNDLFVNENRSAWRDKFNVSGSDNESENDSESENETENDNESENDSGNSNKYYSSNDKSDNSSTKFDNEQSLDKNS